MSLVATVVLGVMPGLMSVAQAAGTIPGTPSITAVTGGDKQATLTFTAPANGGSPITGYKVTFAVGGTTGTASCTGSPCVVTGLTNGTTYSFTLVATNAVGDSLASPGRTAVPRGVPNRPTDVSVTGGSTQATVTFTESTDNGGSTITGYRVTATPTAGGAISSKTFTQSPAGFTGLANGKEYAFTVMALNAIGSSAASDPVTALVGSVPSAPTLKSVASGDKQVVLTFTGSVTNGGFPITGYTANYYYNNPADPSTVVTESKACPVSPCTVSGLTNGVYYVFYVTAENVLGSSPASAYQAATPATLPGAPTDVTLNRGNGQVTVAYKAPADTGGAPITGYRITATPTSGGTGTTKTFTASPSVFTQLTNGQEYSFSVVAVTSAGVSPATDPVNATPVAVPAKPSVTATAGDRSVTLTFNTPASNGTPITGYTATVSSFGTLVAMTSCSTSPCLVDGLTNGAAYTVQLVATNAVGNSLASDARSFTPMGVPARVRNLAATVSDTRVSVSWDAPADDGGSPITGYQYRYVDGDTWYDTWSPSITSASFFGTIGQNYNVVVRAVTASAVGQETTLNVSLLTAPSTPYAVSLTSGDRQLGVTVVAPSANGAPVTGYRVSYYPVADPSSTTVVACPLDGCVLDGLTNGTSYRVRVEAQNSVGYSVPSSWNATPRTTPGKVTALSATTAQQQMFVSWGPPASDGGAPVTYEWKRSTDSAWQASYLPSSLYLNGLAYGQPVTILIRATNVAGPGPSDSVTVTPDLIQDAPLNLTATPGDGTATFTWDPPAPNGGTPVTRYEYQLSGASSWTDNGLKTSVVLSDLINNTRVTFLVRSVSAAGPGNGTSTTVVPAKVVVPLNIRDLAATGGDHSVTVTWKPPTDAGGSAVARYEYQLSGASTWTDNGLSTDVTISGLTNGQPVTVLVRPVDVDGVTHSYQFVQAIPNVAPAKVTHLEAGRGDRQATLAWGTPVDNGGTGVTGYEYKLATSDTWTSLGNRQYSATVTGLTNGVESTFLVRAVNPAGAGDESSITVTPDLVPGTVRDVATVAGDRSAAVSWNAPDDNAGTPITRYEYQLGGDSAWTDNGLATSIRVTGLVYDLSAAPRVISIRAVNAAGPGEVRGLTVEPVRPATVPENVLNIGGSVDDRTATISWDPPTDDGGSPVVRYEYKVHENPYSDYYDPSGDGWTSNDLATSVTVPDLTYGVRTAVYVRAVNAVGASRISVVQVVAQKPVAYPGGVTNLTATPGDRSVTVAWGPPSNPDNLSFYYEYKLATDDDWSYGALEQGVTIRNLVNGTPVKILVRTVTEQGPNPPDSVQATPVAVPDQPVITGATPGDGTISVAFDPPADNGSAITGYTLRYFNGFTDYPAAACSSSPCQLTGLTNGTPYWFFLAAKNAVGVSSNSETVLATPRTIPGKVTALAGAPGDNAAKLSWKEPSGNGGSPVTRYEYQLPGSTTWTSNGLATTLNLTGLTNGTETTVLVRAVNAAGAGPSDSVKVTPVKPDVAPAKISGLTATPGDGTATIGWTAPASNGGSPVTRYEYQLPGSTTWTSNGLATTLNLTGLTNGTETTVLVRAVNAAGAGPSDSVKVTPVKPDVAPAKISGLTATPGDGTATIGWTAPTGNGGSPVTRYEYQLPGSTTWTSNGLATTLNLTGLTNGTETTVLVRAVNAAGAGPSDSVKVTPVKPDVAPAKISGLTATPGDGTATIGWTAPASNGGSPVTRYEYQLPGSTTWTSNGLATTLNLTGLTNGTETTVLVRAVNAAGAGPSDSVKVTPVKPDVAPAKISGLTATPGDGTATIGWTAPASNGGSPVTRYEYQLPGSTTWTSNGLATTLNLTGLTNGTETTVLVRAVNAAGAGPSDSLKVTPVKRKSVPVAPTELKVSRFDTYAVFGFKPPASDGGSPITRYETSVDNGPWTLVQTTTGADGRPGFTLRGFTNATNHQVAVRAVNAVGAGPGTAPLCFTTVGKPTAPRAVTATPVSTTAGAIGVSWTAPASDGGSPVVDYTVTSAPAGGTCTTTTTSCTVTGLVPGRSYSFAVTARNTSVGFADSGTGPSATSAAVCAPAAPKPTVPAAPSGLQGAGGDRTLTVTWDRPATTGGSAISRYEVSVDDAKTWSTVSAVSAGTSRLSATVEGVRNGATYPVRVRAVNAVGTGPTSGLVQVPVVQWFADPLSAVQRAALVAVPANPVTYTGPVRWTKLNAMSASGMPAMGLDQLKGRQMQSGQATSMLGDAMFDFNTTNLTAKGTAQLQSLGTSLKYVKAISCEGYADYGGPATNAQTLSTARAKLVCDRLKSYGAHVVTSYQGYGDSKPVVIGGGFADRAANRRVVVTITQG